MEDPRGPWDDSEPPHQSLSGLLAFPAEEVEESGDDGDPQPGSGVEERVRRGSCCVSVRGQQASTCALPESTVGISQRLGG